MPNTSDSAWNRPNLKRPGDPEMNSSGYSRGRPEHTSEDYIPLDKDDSRGNWRPFHGRWQAQPEMNPQGNQTVPQQPAHHVSQPNGTGRASRRSRRPNNARRENGPANATPVSQGPSFPMSHNNTTEASLPFGQMAPQFGGSNFAFGAPNMAIPSPMAYPAAPNPFAGAFHYGQNPLLQAQFMPWNVMQPWNPLLWNQAMQQQMNFMSTLASYSPVNTANQQTDISQQAAPIFNTAPWAPVSANPAGPTPGTEGATRQRSPSPVIAPVATKQYLEQAAHQPKRLPVAQPLLVILDLNGTLLYRKRRKFPPSFVKRPGLDNFLKDLLKHYTVMVWSSSQPATVAAICESIFSSDKRKKLVAEWGRDKLGLTSSQYREKVQVYKRLEQVWADESIQASYPKSKNKLGKALYKALVAGQQTNSEDNVNSADAENAGVPALSSNLRWDQSNTVLIDDSRLKAISQPYNILEIPEFTDESSVNETEVLKMVLKRLKTLSKHDDVSRMIRFWDSTNFSINGDKILAANDSTGDNDVSEAGATTDDDDDDGEVVVVGEQNQSSSTVVVGEQEQEQAVVADAQEELSALSIKEARRKRMKARKKAKMAARREAKKDHRAS
jgi:hypothetical protein